MFATGRVVNPNAEVSPVTYGDDKSLFVEFYWREVEDPKKSQEQGRPIYVSKEYIKIIAPGDKTKQWDRPVKFRSNGIEPADPDRFPRQWTAFQNQQKQVVEGTPLEEWPVITRADAASMKAINIHTVEQLAALGDNNLSWFGARNYRDKAKAWLESANKGIGASQWAKEKAEMQDQIEALKNTIDGLKKTGLQEASAPPAKRGRKKVKDEQNIPAIDTSSSR